MQRLIWLLVMSLLTPSLTWATWARVSSNSGSNESGSTGTTITTSLTGVTATNTVVCWVKHEGADSVTVTVSDGTTSFTDRPIIHSTHADTTSGQFFYLLSSVASGSVTYTATFSTAVAYRSIACYELSHADTAAFDVSNGSGADSAGGNTITSGTVTTTGSTAVAFGGYAEASAASFSSPLVNGAAADHTTNVGTFGRVWMKTLSATFSGGAATATLPSGNIAATGIIVLKETTGGGGVDTTKFRLRVQP